MENHAPSPPRWAKATLRSVLRPAERASISTDLLTQYRQVQPVAGGFRADAGYVAQVLTVLWPMMRPYLLALTALTLLSLKVKGLWYGSLVQAPLVTPADALIYLCAGYFASRRTGLIRTAAIVTGITSVIGFVILFTAFAIADPSLIAAPFEKPFIFVILSVMLLLAVSFAVVTGSIGGIFGRWLPPAEVDRVDTVY